MGILQSQKSEAVNGGVLSKKVFLTNFAKFSGKKLPEGPFFNNPAGPRTATLLEKIAWYRCFPLNFAKLLRTPFYRTHPDDCF